MPIFETKLLTLDPSLFANGVYRLRLSAWDLVGRSSTLEARIVIDSTQKNFATVSRERRQLPIGGT